jgi:hypothetical protein
VKGSITPACQSVDSLPVCSAMVREVGLEAGNAGPASRPDRAAQSPLPLSTERLRRPATHDRAACASLATAVSHPTDCGTRLACGLPSHSVDDAQWAASCLKQSQHATSPRARPLVPAGGRPRGNSDSPVVRGTRVASTRCAGAGTTRPQPCGKSPFFPFARTWSSLV